MNKRKTLLADMEDIKESSNKLVKLSNDINIKRHTKPAFFNDCYSNQNAYKYENGVYIVPLCCLKD